MATLPAVPFGTQYYRAPVPEPDKWDRDLAAMAAAGLDSIKIWVQWRWNHPEPDRMDFDDILGLCDSAGKHGLAVIPNAILDVAPTWLYDEHPDAHMVTAAGRVCHPRVTSCRQIGGSPGPCYHHQRAWDRAWDFLNQAASALAESPAVWGWDLWNEPELSMIQRFEWTGSLDPVVCYCRRTREAFVQWVMQRYGSLDAVNAAWGRNYARPEQIEPARGLETYRDAIDWRLFFRDTLTANMARRAEIIRAAAPDARVITHTVPPPALTVVNASADEWKLAEPVEEFGASFPRYAPLDYEMDVNRSAAKGKRLWSAEFYPGVSNNPPLTDAYRAELHELVFAPLMRGYKGYLIWQWRQEAMGVEGGWSAHAGRPTLDWPAVAELKRLIDLLRDHGDWLAEAQPAAARVAILHDVEAELFSWAAAGAETIYQDALIGCHQALTASNLPVHFVHADEVVAGGLAEYDALLAPHSTWASQRLAEALREWTAAGGVLIAEADFARRDPADGRGWPIVPGCGMHEVFGARQSRLRGRGAAEAVEMTLAAPVGALPAGTKLPGFGVEEHYVPAEGAEVLATAPDGAPMLVRQRFGAGSAATIGTFVSVAHRRGRGADVGALLLGLLGDAVAAERPIVTGGEGVRVETLGAGARQWLLVRNPGPAARIALSLPADGPAGRWRRLLADGELSLTADAAGRRVGSLELPAGAVALYDSGRR